MCVSCLSGAEVVAGHAVAGVALTRGWWRRRRLLRQSPDVRAREAQLKWDGNAAFMASLGHDPTRILGTRPETTADRDRRNERVTAG